MIKSVERRIEIQKCERMDEKKEYIKIEHLKSGGWYVLSKENIGDIKDILDDMIQFGSAGDGYKITLIEMTGIEFKNLPEFEGF